MKAYILSDHWSSGVGELDHTTILRENLQEAAQAIHAEIMSYISANRALVRIRKDHVRSLNIPTLNYRLHAGRTVRNYGLHTDQAVDEGHVLCLLLSECHLTTS